MPNGARSVSSLDGPRLVEQRQALVRRVGDRDDGNARRDGAFKPDGESSTAALSAGATSNSSQAVNMDLGAGLCARLRRRRPM